VKFDDGELEAAFYTVISPSLAAICPAASLAFSRSAARPRPPQTAPCGVETGTFVPNLAIIQNRCLDRATDLDRQITMILGWRDAQISLRNLRKLHPALNY
jgi:hypothetical protein